MHTVELLEAALTLARQVGYCVREEWLDGKGGGACEVKGHKWLFLDLALSPEEQLDHVVNALRHDPAIVGETMSEPLRRLLGTRKSA